MRGIALFGLCVCAVLAAALPRAQAAEVEDARLWRAPDRLRLVFDLSGPAEHRLLALENPDRVVIDIRGAAGAGPAAELDFGDGPVRALRAAPRDDGLRVVLDLRRAVDPRSFALAPGGGRGDRLVIDLHERAAPAAPSRPAPPAPSARRDIVVAVSAGHGGEDPGAIGRDGRIREKDVALAISRALAAQLERMPGYRAVMIRDGDYYVPLRRRPRIAREHRADLFVAVHADWYRNRLARGATVYALSGDRADREKARRVEEKENSSDLLGGVGGDTALAAYEDDVARILVDLNMDWSMRRSLAAGTRVIESLAAVTRVRRGKVQQASLQVLNSPDIPSILIETGYLTNPEEARLLSSARFQERLAGAIAQGIADFFLDAPPEGSLVAWWKAGGGAPGSYAVERGDSLSEIAARFGVPLARLRSANALGASDLIVPGQVLVLPGAAGPREHTVRRGETLSGIAERHRVGLSSLRRANGLSGDRILAGQVLRIPPG